MLNIQLAKLNALFRYALYQMETFNYGTPSCNALIINRGIHCWASITGVPEVGTVSAST